MLYRPLLAAATIICLAAAAAPAQPAQDCAGGALSLETLANSDCAARIPLPTARPDKIESADAQAETKTWEFIETPGAAPGETRRVRLVGSRFLPDRSESINFQAHASSQVGLFDAALHRAVAYFGLTAARETDDKSAGVVQEARVNVSTIALPN